MNIIWFKDCNYDNKELVGGKNASLGELYWLSKTLNFKIANGFAVSTNLYINFLKQNNLDDKIILLLNSINYDNLNELHDKSKQLRDLILTGVFTEEQEKEMLFNYNELSKFYNTINLSVAVRSSAVAEDLPNASFAGQQDTYLNVTTNNLIVSVKKCFASLFNTRAISYRKTNKIDYKDVLISVGIQKMVRSDIGSAGVAFSIDPETGYDKAIVINSAFGLGELVVSGGVKPDEVIVDKRILVEIGSDPIIMKKIGDKNTKIVYTEDGIEERQTNLIEKINFSISNQNSIELARYVLSLEKNYSKILNKKIAVDVEWAIDGFDKKIYIIQTRPETVHSNQKNNELIKYKLVNKPKNSLINGIAIGEKITCGKVKLLNNVLEFDKFNKGDILVTDMTTPDWEPIMKISNGIITNRGGRTCHAAIVARELGINAIVGAGNVTEVLKNEQEVTLNCSDGEVGNVYQDFLEFNIDRMEIDTSKELPVKLMQNVGSPDISFSASLLPHKGIGLARLEFIITNYIKIHPLALCDYPHIKEDVREKIYNTIGENDDGKWYFVKRLSRGIAKIASAFYPEDVIVRFSDFKSNEYKNLIGGEIYEPQEENPMISWRGASRYYSEEYSRAFELECMAIHYVRTVMKCENVIVMIPFCRTPEECNKVLETMKKYGLERGVDGLQVYIMCEIPSNVIEADRFAPLIDGVSIGGNDLLQLTLGIDRDSEKIANLSKDDNISYRRMISMAIKTYREYGVKVGFCGQQPSDSLEFCNFLIDEGIDSISVTPDSVIKTINSIQV